MGNRSVNKFKRNRKRLNELREHMRNIRLPKRIRGRPRIPSLAVLCGKVIKKFKLIPEPKKFAPPDSFSIIGGKPLRKRSVRLSPEEIKEEKRKKKCRNPLSLASLCQIVIKGHNLLPECEETLRPSAGTSSVHKNTSRKRGITKKEIKKQKPTKRRKEKPRKDTATKEDNTSNTVTYMNYSTFLQESQDTRKIKVEEELNLPVEVVDPLQDDDYTVVIKEECFDEEDRIATPEVPVTIQVPQATSRGMIINPMAYAEIPGPSGRGLTAAPHYMTVLVDEYQVFANSVAEQLRALPSNRALLLQLDIQSMLDNEKQILLHEN